MPEVNIPVEAPEQVVNTVKKWHDGKTTYTAAISAIVISVGGIFGFTFNENLPIEIARYGDFIQYTVYLCLGIVAWWGRAKALKPGFIGKKKLENSNK